MSEFGHFREYLVKSECTCPMFKTLFSSKEADHTHAYPTRPILQFLSGGVVGQKMRAPVVNFLGVEIYLQHEIGDLLLGFSTRFTATSKNKKLFFITGHRQTSSMTLNSFWRSGEWS